MSKQSKTRVSPVFIALLFAMQTVAMAHPRPMTDEELDQVCAKGTTGVALDPSAISDMIFQFQRQTSIGMVTGSGVIHTEVLPNNSSQAHDPVPSALSSSIPPVTTTVASGSGSFSVSALPAAGTGDVQPIDVRVNGQTVRITTDININVQTLPGAMRALGQNGLVIPNGINMSLGAVQGGPH